MAIQSLMHRFIELSNIHSDLDVMMRCIHNLSRSANPAGVQQFEGGLENYTKERPIFFANKTYREVRRALVKRMFVDDEKMFGINYNATH